MTDLELINLQDNTELSTVRFDNHDDWLDKRRAGVGGSDIGALMGLNKYSSPLKIYKQKCEGWSEDMSDNVFVKKGTDLEDWILDNHVRPALAKEGLSVIKPDFMIINSTCPYLRANVDGMAYNYTKHWTENIGVEIKWVSSFAEEHWRGAEYLGIPPSYYAQVQLYMAVTGLKEWRLFALFDSTWTCEMFKIPRDDEFIARLKIVAEKFYRYNMAMHIPPSYDVTVDTDDITKAAKTVEKPTIANASMTNLVIQYNKLQASIKAQEKEQSEIKNAILDLYCKGYCPDDSAHKVNLTSVTSHRFNSTRFKNEHPELYEEYCEDAESSRFTIK